MRTRRSPRNQLILWRALGGPPPETPKEVPPQTAEEIKAMWWISKRSRNMRLRELAKRETRARIVEGHSTDASSNGEGDRE